MFALYDKTCFECSRLITRRYSTSFSLGIRAFSPEIRRPIYAVYGFVRFADEIVDTFHGYPKEELLQRFRADTDKAIAERISYNPVLHAFQKVVHEFGIERRLIDAFLDSMEMDLYKNTYNKNQYEQYIYGSAEVVGLMCLQIFCAGDKTKYAQLEASARSLGAAFQKVNFLRDLKSDFDERGRVYFPGVDFDNFTSAAKAQIEADISADFKDAYVGILQLPPNARFGVYLAYKYYLKLFHKIRQITPCKIKEQRIRVNDGRKFFLLLTSVLRVQLNML